MSYVEKTKTLGFMRQVRKDPILKTRKRASFQKVWLVHWTKICFTRLLLQRGKMRRAH